MEANQDSLPESAASPISESAGWPMWLAPLLIALLTLVAFFPPLAQKDFLSLGERTLLVENARYRGLGISNLSWAFGLESAEVGRQYHPLVWLSFGVDRLLWRDAARGYHLTNVLLHFLSAVFVYLIAGRLFTAASEGRPAAPGSGQIGIRLGALLAGLLFAVHPLRAESVAWMVERRDVLCGFFFLASILCYLRCRDLAMPLSLEDPSARKPGWPRIWMAVSVVLALCAVLSKATAVCLPLVLIVLDVYPLGESAKRIKGVWWDRAPFIVVAGIGLLTALQALGESPLPGPESSLARVVVALHGSLLLLFKMVWPVGLQPIYESPADLGWSADAGRLVGAVAAVVVTVVLLLLRRRWPAGLVAWLCYLVMLLPVSGLVRIGVPVEADHHSYLAGMPWAVLLGAGLWALSRRGGGAAGVRPVGGVLAVVAAVVVLFLAGLTYGQCKVWRDDKNLWARVVEVQPEYWRAHANLGLLLRQANDLDGAEQCYRQAVRLKPDAWEVHNNLGQVLSIKGERERHLKGQHEEFQKYFEEGLEHFRKAKEINPASPAPRQNMVNNLFMLGRTDEAGAELRELLSLLPEEASDAMGLKRVRARALNDLGTVYYTQGKYDQAIESYRQCLDLLPVFPTAHQGLGDAWLAKGEINQAVAHFEEALRFKPDDEAVRRKLMELRGQQVGPATPDAVGPAPGPELTEEARQFIARSLTRLREALEEDPKDVAAHYEMAVLQARLGQLEQCVYHCRETLLLKPDHADACYLLVRVLKGTKRASEAVAAAREGLAQAPEQPNLLGFLAHLLATSSDPAIADAQEALKLAERANQLEADNPSLLEVLAVAYAANERLDEAIQALGRAKTLAETRGLTPVVERLSKELEAYQKRRSAGPTP